MALDDAKENDYSYTHDSGVILVADNELLKDTGTITIDWTGMGFNLKSEIPLAKASGKCGGCAGADSCGDNN